MADCLSLSLVVYHSDTALLQQTLQTAHTAAAKAQSAGLISDFFLSLVDNAEGADAADPNTLSALHAAWPNTALSVYAPGNIGYGAGHNLAIKARCGSFHLVINPDVLVDEDALIECIQYLNRHPRVGMVTPRCHRPDGQQEYLCKTYPSVGVLLLRGFAPGFIKRYFQAALCAYEPKDLGGNEHPDILIASGCFMFFRQQALLDVKGFCEQFFLYFEDFDLSLRLTQQWQIAYVPAVKIVHYGGHSAAKGWQHIIMFARSARLFFNRHGWRFW